MSNRYRIDVTMTHDGNRFWERTGQEANDLPAIADTCNQLNKGRNFAALIEYVVVDQATGNTVDIDGLTDIDVAYNATKARQYADEADGTSDFVDARIGLLAEAIRHLATAIDGRIA